MVIWCKDVNTLNVEYFSAEIIGESDSEQSTSSDASVDGARPG
jgi:hypothetical protein